MKRLRRLTLVAILAVATGQAAECQGWLATAEARMACCANEQECPMHKAGRHSTSSLRISQSDADRCCAQSEHGDSMPTFTRAASVDSVALLPVGLPGVIVSAAAWHDHGSELVNSPPSRRARHVFLSVFLI